PPAERHMPRRGPQAVSAALSTRRMFHATLPIPPFFHSLPASAYRTLSACRQSAAPVSFCQAVACILKRAATFAFSGITRNANSLRRPPARGGLCFGLAGRWKGPEDLGFARAWRGGRECRARAPAFRRRGVEHRRIVL